MALLSLRSTDPASRVGPTYHGTIGVTTAFLAAVILGCHEPEGEPSQDHSALQPDSLVGQLVTNAPAIGQPGLLAISGWRLWVTDYISDPGLHLIDTRVGELVRSVGRRGEGPGEFASFPFGLEVAPSDSSAAWAWDPTLQRLTRFQWFPAPNADLETIVLGGKARARRVSWVDEDRIIGVGPSEEARFALFSANGQLDSVVPSHFFGDSQAPTAQREQAWDQTIRVCGWPGRGFVIVYGDYGRIEYFDRDAEMLRTAEVPFPSDPLFQATENGSLRYTVRRFGYVDCSVSGEFLFALYSGRLRSAFEGISQFSANYVHVFDWAGKLRAVFHLDQEVVGIAADVERGNLFSGSMVDAGVYRFSFSPSRLR